MVRVQADQSDSLTITAKMNGIDLGPQAGLADVLAKLPCMGAGPASPELEILAHQPSYMTAVFAGCCLGRVATWQ